DGGVNLNLKDDLNFGSTTKVFGRLKVETPSLLPNVYFLATPMSFNGAGSKNVDFVFGNQTFSRAVPFTSHLTLNHYDAALYYGLPFIKTATLGILNIDVGVDARLVDLKSSIVQTTTGLSQTRSFTRPLPMGYVGVQVTPVTNFSLEGEVRGVVYSDEHYFDFIGRAKIKIVGPAFIAAGYRYEKLHLTESGVHADTGFGGPFGEIGIEL